MVEKTKTREIAMDIQDIQKLITMLEKSNLSELELETAGTKIRLAKAAVPSAPPAQSAPQFLMMPSSAPAHPQAYAASPANAPVTAAPAQVAPTPAEAAAPAAKVKSPTAVELKSPMVGTFYRAPAPGAGPFAKVGDRVKKGQTLCIIEAMKLMNEIECELDGVVVDILTENAQPVEYGEVLMHIDPQG